MTKDKLSLIIYFVAVGLQILSICLNPTLSATPLRIAVLGVLIATIVVYFAKKSKRKDEE